MTFDEVLAQVKVLLQQQKRVSYRGIKRRFTLDDEYLEDLKEELIGALRLATDEDGRYLVWTGAAPVPKTERPVASASPSSPPSAHSPVGERRQLTVMFIDLVGSTILSQQLDPEEYHARVVAYQDACRQVIARYEGHVAQYLGDGILAYFGYPAAHEDDAARAIRSGLECVTVVSQLAYMPPLQVRIGVHTGPVIVGEIGTGERTEMLALGETPNLAARIQGIAEPNTVCLSPVTHKLVQGLFECQDSGLQPLKGITTPLSLYRVLGEGTAQNRFDVAIGRGLTPLVGREEELNVLQRRWEQAKAGAGHVVLLSGEPGIGKSRLVQELKGQVSAEGATPIEFRCSPYHQNSALYPIIDHLQRLLQFAREASPTSKLEKLRQKLSHYRFPQADTLPLLAALLSLPHPEGSPPITVSPQKQKEQTQTALVAWLIEEAEKATVLCAWEDVHWADPSTLEVLTLLLDQAPTTRLLALLTFRPEFAPPWGNRSHLSQLTVSRLGRTQVEAMVEQVTRENVLSPEVVQQIADKTDGVPLFVEELTKSVIESGGAEAVSPLQFSIPATLQDSLMARLDRLNTAKEIAQLGATIGREFSYELLHAVSPLDEASLQRGLRQLVEVELLYQRGLLPQAIYLFKHALIQDTAYQSLLKSRRQQLHQQIAQVLVALFPDTAETQPELLAHHYTEANLIEQAIPYWQQAGERATQRSAYVEAVSHLTKGLELLKALPATPERVQRELTLQLALGDALVSIKGYTVPEVEEAYARARELSRQASETPQLFSVLFRLSLVSLNRGELHTTLELSKQQLRLAQSIQDPYLLSVAHMALGCTLQLRGEFIAARFHLEQVITLYNPQNHPRPTVNTADPRVDCLSYLSWLLWILGYPDQGLKRSQEAMALAEELAHPFSLAYALGAAALFHSFRREWQLAREKAEAVIALSTEQGFPYWWAFGSTILGQVLAEQGYVKEGIAQIQQGLTALEAMGTETARSGRLITLAAPYAQIGRTEEGLTVLDDALSFMDKTGQRLLEVWIYVLKGWLLLARSQKNQAEAESCFYHALNVARRQGGKALELRATMSLARLWQQQGKKNEARHMLAEVYNWFTEGFDTKDLQEAKTLLEELR